MEQALVVVFLHFDTSFFFLYVPLCIKFDILKVLLMFGFNNFLVSLLINFSCSAINSRSLDTIGVHKLAIVKALLAHGVNATNEEDWNALDYVILKKNDEMINGTTPNSS